MPNRSYKGAQRIVYLTPALDLAVKQYLDRHQGTTFSPWIRGLIERDLKMDGQMPADSPVPPGSDSSPV